MAVAERGVGYRELISPISSPSCLKPIGVVELMFGAASLGMVGVVARGAGGRGGGRWPRAGSARGGGGHRPVPGASARGSWLLGCLRSGWWGQGAASVRARLGGGGRAGFGRGCLASGGPPPRGGSRLNGS